MKRNSLTTFPGPGLCAPHGQVSVLAEVRWLEAFTYNGEASECQYQDRNGLTGVDTDR